MAVRRLGGVFGHRVRPQGLHQLWLTPGRESALPVSHAAPRGVRPSGLSWMGLRPTKFD